MTRCLGTTDERTTCDRCGRADLKGTVVFELGSGAIVYYGSDCASRVLGRPEREIKAEAKKADTERREAQFAKERQEAEERSRPWFAFLKRKTGIDEVCSAIRVLGGFAQAKAAFVAEGGAF